MAIHCVAAEHGGLIKKETAWVKLKAFPTNVGRPNKVLKYAVRVRALHAQRIFGCLFNCRAALGLPRRTASTKFPRQDPIIYVKSNLSLSDM